MRKLKKVLSATFLNTFPHRTKAAMQKWTIEKSAELYNIEGWGSGYFGINEQGHIIVRPEKTSQNTIDLKLLVDDIQSKGYALPALIRFSDILKSSIAGLANAFQKASEEHNYTGTYHGVYPIKVNQQRQVVEEIVKFGRPYNIGLEAGSKPELHAILAIMDNPEALLICNGYKDETFIRLALMGQKLGKRVFIVVERLSELNTIVRVARELEVTPNIGLRIKLTSAGSGRWASSGGEYSKADGLAVYQRCKILFSMVLGSTPSDATESVHKSLSKLA